MSSAYPDNRAAAVTPNSTKQSIKDIVDSLNYWTLSKINEREERGDEYYLSHNFAPRTIILKKVEVRYGKETVWNAKLLTPDNEKPRQAATSEISEERESIPEMVRAMAERKEITPRVGN